MAAKHTLHVAVTEPLKQFVRAQIDSGRYANASEVVRDALVRLNERNSATSGEKFAVRSTSSSQPI